MTDLQTQHIDANSVSIDTHPPAKNKYKYSRKHHYPIYLYLLLVLWFLLPSVLVLYVLATSEKQTVSTSVQHSPNQTQPASAALATTTVAPPLPKLPSIAAKPKGIDLLAETNRKSRSRTASDSPFECDAPIESSGTIDTLVFSKLSELKIQPAKLCSDEAFLRRVYVDVIGTLPTMDEAAEFLDDEDPNKRNNLIDELLERDEYADYWAMKWCDVLRVKAEFPINLWPQASQAYHHWIHNIVKKNVPYDAFARELLTASGSNFRTPQVNFYRATQNTEPQSLAQIVALTFMGERADKWPAERLQAMSVFFSQVGYKPTGEWKEEIIYFDRRQAATTGQNSQLQATFPNGVVVEIPVGEDPRAVFADWLVSTKNPWFARVGVNRLWHWLLGRGIVEPPDDVRVDNPPSNKELLNGLAEKFVGCSYDIKHMIRLILRSNAYQLSCIPQSEDSRTAEYFAYYSPRRLDAEVMIDAICQITGTTETYMSITPEPFTFLPDGTRAISIPDGSITSSFLEMFGRPARDTGMVSERNNRLTAGQALHLLNSNHLRGKLKQGFGMKQILSRAISSTDAAERLYLAILSRRPTEKELQIADSVCRSDEGQQDLAWALINSDEFLFRH